MKYTYVGMNAMGARVVGDLECESEVAAIHELASKGVTVLEVKKVRNLNLGIKPFRSKELANLMMQLAFMFEAGVQLPKALDTMNKNASTFDEVKITGMLLENISNGMSVSQAFEVCSKKFRCIKESHLRQLEAGENGNFIDKSCRDIATSIYNSLDNKGKIKSAMMYPIFIVILMIVIVVFMLVMIIPKMQSVFDELGGELPAITQFVVTASDIIQRYGILVAGIIALVVIISKVIISKNKTIHLWVDKVKTKIPLIGKIIHTGQIIEFCDTMGTLIDKGIVAGEALKTSIGVVDNLHLKDKLEYSLIEVINNGRSLSDSLRISGIFPSIIIQCIEVGEQSSKIPQILNTVSVQLKRELSDRIKALTTAMEPLMIVMIGGVVGVILLAIYLPLIEMNNLF